MGGTSVKNLMEVVLSTFEPPPNLTLSEWADTYRILPEGSPEPGQWSTAKAEYQREILDVMTHPDTRRVVIMGASQTVKSEAELNLIGYHIHMDPCTMMMVQPDEKNAEEFATDRIVSMIKATPELRGTKDKPVVYDEKKGVDGQRSNKHMKRFKGGFLAIASANVPASLASKPIRVLMFDEVDRYSLSSGKEGDPVMVAEKRTRNFWNKLIVLVSSPLIKDESRIEHEYS